MQYDPPLDAIRRAMAHTAPFGRPVPPDDGVADAVLAEAGRFAAAVIAPLNASGDRIGASIADGVVTLPAGWRDAYQAWQAAGWNGVAAPEAWGGQGLPHLLNAACVELWNAASLSFGIGPILTMGAVEALLAHGSDALKQTYLPKLVSGEWMGTMQLTEPLAGSDVGALRTRAERYPDGSYRLFGQKIFITYGEHELTPNIVHLVLARLPDAPAGTRGISLFLVPKCLVNNDGSLGARNDVHAHALEHKLGLHASPTCTMVLGDADGAIGYIVGSEHAGMACMFTMMNPARLNVGLQGVAIAERATQQAMAYARERRQGRARGIDGSAPIIAHPDVRRMLLTMQSVTRAARAICYATAAARDVGAENRVALLTPVAKAFATDIASEVASLAIQVHGGAGYIEETGVAQHYRDARILSIYEGTNGIQAIDLVTRKLANRDAASEYLAELQDIRDSAGASDDPAIVAIGARLRPALDALAQATAWLQERNGDDAVLAGATPYLRLFALTAGGYGLLRQAMANDADAHAMRIARFFADNIAVQAGGLSAMVTDGAGSIVEPFA